MLRERMVVSRGGRQESPMGDARKADTKIFLNLVGAVDLIRKDFELPIPHEKNQLVGTAEAKIEVVVLNAYKGRNNIIFAITEHIGEVLVIDSVLLTPIGAVLSLMLH